MQFLNADYAFERVLYGQIRSSYFKEDVADASAVLENLVKEDLEPAEDAQFFGGSLGQG